MTDGPFGPFLAVAVFCEKVLIEKDNVASAIRIVDQVTLTARGTTPPDTMPTFPYQLSLYILLKSGAARGRHTLRVIPELPSGLKGPEQQFPLHLKGEEHGEAVIVNMQMALGQEGLYWFDVWFEQQLLTRVPLRAVYRPLRL